MAGSVQGPGQDHGAGDVRERNRLANEEDSLAFRPVLAIHSRRSPVITQ
jgi:hypothetical protein